MDVYIFWKYPNYNIASNRSNPSIPVTNTTISSGCIEHVLLKDDNDFDPFLNTLEDFLANEKSQSKKRARVKDIEDKDDSVKIVSIASNTFNHTISTGIASKWPARPRNSKSI